MTCVERCRRAHPDTTCWVCTRCRVDVGADGFYRRLTGPLVGKRASLLCKQCMNRTAKPKDPEKNRAKAQQWRDRLGREVELRRHGITGEQYDARLATQGGVCAICEGDPDGGRTRFAIDHDHACCPGKKSCGECIRGLLCLRCNAGIGMLRDDPDMLAKAIQYLTKGSN